LVSWKFTLLTLLYGTGPLLPYQLQAIGTYTVVVLRLFAATISKYRVSINLWQRLEFNIAIFGIFLFCHAVTITRNRVTKIICIAIFWSYLPCVAASVTVGIHIILR